MVKILIVEDEESIQTSLVDMLELAEHDVIVADDGEIGFQLAQQHIPDLIISDIMMPGMDGYALLEVVKSELTTAHIPFIFLTALASYDDVREGMNLGVDDYLTKPFDYKQLTTAVNARLNKYAREEQLRLHRFAQRLVNLQERERRQLAYDLETDIHEPLSGLKVMLALARQTGDFSIIQSASQIVDDTISRSQRLSLRLLPTVIEHLNIIAVLVWLFEEYKTHHSFKIDFERAGHLPDCTLDEKIIIYRIFEEILKNINLHAGTRTVSIRLAVRDNYLFADIRDDGKGFNVQQALNSGTSGLQSMFERATLLNGELNIHSIRGDGTQVTLEFPVSVLTDEKTSLPPKRTPVVPLSTPVSISSIRVLIADDYDIMRHGLQQILGQDDAIIVVGHASNRSDLLNMVRQQEVDIIILDMTMDGSSGFDMIKILLQQSPESRIIAFSNHTQEVYAVEALKSGANGYLLKEASSLEVINAIHKVVKGEQYISESIADKAFEWMLNSRSSTGDVTNIYDLLTDREREIMLLAITGLTSADIADELAISPRTVEKHRSNFMSKLGLKTPAQLMKFASEQGLIG